MRAVHQRRVHTRAIISASEINKGAKIACARVGKIIYYTGIYVCVRVGFMRETKGAPKRSSRGYNEAVTIGKRPVKLDFA